ncbi:MAG: N-acetylmuramoyl-L-alanine amidase [Paludibacteraceae bacterium]|nr:N-acetylmuramoyl-L-alanine amidase [Paludibacteraceae bacterium]
MMRKFVGFVMLAALVLSLQSFTVVIDAGHGGHDAGAVGLTLGTMEKDLNLSVALGLAEQIREKYPEVKVILTRDSDVFLPLQKRADVVNKCKDNAKLFISIHTNAADNRNARGAETFILGTERMEDNLDVAMRENSVMKLEQDLTVYQGFDNSIESYIMFELMQHDYMENSLVFAERVQNEFVGTLKRANRGVRQAAFWVLLKSACPGVLVEMGFISNEEEEKWLSSEEGQAGIVNSIFTAFEKYYKENVK